MTQELEKIIENLQQSESLILANRTYSEESIVNESLQCTILIELNIWNSEFTEIDFIGSDIVQCTFQNCKFENVEFRKCEFLNSTFLNCTFQNCDITRASFEEGKFKNCKLINNNLKASSFSQFEFIETTFEDNNMDLVSVESSKIWKLKHCIEIKEDSYLENFLDNTCSKD